MTQFSPKNSAPQLLLSGFDDRSVRAQPPVATPTPIHCPLFFGFFQRGPEVPLLISDGTLANTYGEKSLDYRGPYVTHATPFIRTANENANAMMLLRLRPADARVATMRISLDLLEKELPIYERDSEGYYVRIDGDLVPTGETTPGYIGRWVVEQIAGGVGTSTVRPGSMSENGIQSAIYPVMDIPVSSFGAWGNNLGIRLWSPTTLGADPIDDDLAIQERAYIYRLQVVERADERSTPAVRSSIFGERYVEFALREGAVNTRVQSELFVDRVIQDQFRDMQRTPVPEYGPFETVFVYHNHVATLSNMIFGNESLLNSVLAQEPDNQYLVNLFGGTDFNGAPYHSFILEGALESAPEFVENATHYFMGGADGTMGNAAFNTAVRQVLNTFHSSGYNWDDMARYPFSAFYDSGFDVDTKMAIPRILGVRKDAHVALAVQDAMLPPLSTSEESSMAIALRAALRLYPESTIFGTPCCRGVVMAQSGRMLNSTYPHRVPMTLELLAKRARYLGASDGFMKSAFAYDEDPNNGIQYLYDISNPSKPSSVRNRDWDNGLVWVQNYDVSRLFIPAFQTVYDRPDSVLNSDLNMQIATELNKVCFRVWRQLVGNTRLTRDQFIQRSNELIAADVQDRFDGRVVIVPETEFTANDDARGYSWTCRINMYGNVMRTVKLATVVTHRLEDLV